MAEGVLMTAQRTSRMRKLATSTAKGVLDTSARTALASKLNQLIDARGLSQAQATRVLGMPQPKISAIRNLKLNAISLERLLQALASLDQHVDIVVAPSRRGMPAGIRVDAHVSIESALSRSVDHRE
jgi:predicted XRE-type DNA-binding protein